MHYEKFPKQVYERNNVCGGKTAKIELKQDLKLVYDHLYFHKNLVNRFN